MVRADVWPGPHGGFLHVACLEAELGRQLQPDDFTDCTANLWPLAPPDSDDPDVDALVVLAQRITGLDMPYVLSFEEYCRRENMLHARADREAAERAESRGDHDSAVLLRERAQAHEDDRFVEWLERQDTP